MSRVGKRPIPIPDGTKVEIKEGVFAAKGPKGELTQSLFEGYEVSVDNGTVTVEPPGDAPSQRALHGLLRSLIANAVNGVSTGWSKQLEIIGVGYRAEVKGDEIHLALGYSHPVVYKVPQGIAVEVDKQNRVTISGVDRQQVGQVAAELRSLRRPDPYKGKGIRYVGEVVRRKVGKAGAR